MIARAFNKKVKPRNLKEGDSVPKVLRDETFDPRGKMKPRRTLQIWMEKRCFA